MTTSAVAPDAAVLPQPLPPELRLQAARIAGFAILLALIGLTFLALLIVLPYQAVVNALRTLPRPVVAGAFGVVIVIATCLLRLLADGMQISGATRPAADVAGALRRIRVLLMICLAVGLPACLLGFVAAGDPWVAVWPLSALTFGIACGCLLNLVRSTLHRIEPPTVKRASRGFSVILAKCPQTAADGAPPVAAIADPPVAGSVDAEEALSTILHALAGLGILVYGFRLWPLVLISADFAAGGFAAATSPRTGQGVWVAAMIVLALAAGACALYWVVWGITCVGTGARWYRTTLAFGWATNFVSAMRLLICMLLAMQGLPYWLREMLAASLENPHLRGLSLWAGVADLAFPIILLVLLTRVPVRALFLEYQGRAWEAGQ